MFDELEIKMDDIDSLRETKIFIPRLREEWMDAFTKRYIQDGGEIGTELLPKEL